VLYVSCEVCQLVLAEFVESVEEENLGRERESERRDSSGGCDGKGDVVDEAVVLSIQRVDVAV
jgi:hypothetical protein